MRMLNSALFIAAFLAITINTVLSILVFAEFFRQRSFESSYLNGDWAKTQLIWFGVSIPHLYSFTFLYSAFSFRNQKLLLFYGFNTPILLTLNLLFAFSLRSSF